MSSSFIPAQISWILITKYDIHSDCQSWTARQRSSCLVASGAHQAFASLAQCYEEQILLGFSQGSMCTSNIVPDVNECLSFSLGIR